MRVSFTGLAFLTYESFLVCKVETFLDFLKIKFALVMFSINARHVFILTLCLVLVVGVFS